jgi:hypothetical protein
LESKEEEPEPNLKFGFLGIVIIIIGIVILGIGVYYLIAWGWHTTILEFLGWLWQQMMYWANPKRIWRLISE